MLQLQMKVEGGATVVPDHARTTVVLDHVTLLRHDTAKHELLNAKQYIVSCGWKRGTYGNYNFGFCVIGALRQGSSRGASYWEAVRRLWNALPGSFPHLQAVDMEQDCYAYNDGFLHEKEEALAWIDRAIAI